MDIQANIKRFEELLGSVKREGIENMLKYCRNSDFYKAPASTIYHLSCEGGLLQHSLNVYDCLVAKRQSPFWKNVLKDVTDESLIIVALLHDLCKTYFYVGTTKNQKTYDPEKVAKAASWQVKTDSMGSFIWETVAAFTVEDQMPLGHGEKSVFIASQYIKLLTPEMYAIRWHMGYSEDSSQYRTLGAAMQKHSLVLALNEADLEASQIIEDTNGNKI